MNGVRILNSNYFPSTPEGPYSTDEVSVGGKKRKEEKGRALVMTMTMMSLHARATCLGQRRAWANDG